MLTWVKLILSVMYFGPMLLFSLVLFRQRIKPYWKQISLAVVAGSIVKYAEVSPLLLVCVICVLLMLVWRYRIIPALLVALSGYLVSINVSTLVLLISDSMNAITYEELQDNILNNALLQCVGFVAKCCVLLTFNKMRLGFTFLSNYTRITFARENVTVYLFIIVAILGIAYHRTTPSPESIYSAMMPIQMLIVATVLFLFITLSKELGVPSRSTRG